MADHPCLKELIDRYKKAGKTITSKNAQKWLTEVTEGTENLSPDDIIARAQRIGNEKIRQAYLTRRNTALALKAEVRMHGYVAENWKDDVIGGLKAYMGGNALGISGSQMSVFTNQIQYKAKMFSGLLADLDKAKSHKDFISGTMDRDIAVEMSRLNKGKEAPTNNSKAVQIAVILKKHMDYGKNLANKYGADIRNLDGYITEQTHDMYKLRTTTVDQWVKDTYSRLDVKKTFGDTPESKHKGLMEEIYRTLADGEQFKIPIGDNISESYKGTTNIGKTKSRSRVLHFQDADKWMEYNKLYGAGNLRETISDQMVSHAHSAGLMQMMGPNPEVVLERVINRLGANKTNEAASRALADRRGPVYNLLKTLTGEDSVPHNPNGARYGTIWRYIQSLSKLGGAVLSAVVDIPIAASELRYEGQGFLSAYNTTLLGGYNNLPKHLREEYALKLGIYNDGLIHDMGMELSGRGGLDGKASNLMALYFKMNLLTPWTNRMRRNVALSMSGRLGHLADKGWAELEPDLQRTLGLLNITERDWPALSRAVDVDPESGYKFMTPDAVDNLSDEVISEIYGVPVGEGKFDFSKYSTDLKTAADVRNDLANRFRSYFVNRTQVAVVAPDARTNAMLRQGLQPGSVAGESMRMIMQFKAFPLAVMHKVMGRQIYGKGHRTAWEAIQSGSAMMGLAETVVLTTGFGYLAMTAKDLLRGKEPRDPLNPSTMMAAMLQGGALGLVGDFVLGTSNRYGHDAFTTLAGPTASVASDAIKLISQIRDGDDPSASALNLIKGNTPFANLFYTRAAFDYLLFYRMQEYINPGYLQRMEQRSVKETGQQWYFKPSEQIPYGGGF